MQALFNDTVVAESDRTVVVEGNHYFPPDAVRAEYFTPTTTHTTCPWKGEASYYTVRVGDSAAEDAAWTYPHPKPAAAEITGYVAFWRGVKVVAATGEARP